ncbi:MAG: hypothetical protein ACR2L2_20580 [Acidobacteriota bacterium]
MSAAVLEKGEKAMTVKMKLRTIVSACALLLVLFNAEALATVYDVGPGQPFPTIGSVP